MRADDIHECRHEYSFSNATAPVRSSNFLPWTTATACVDCWDERRKQRSRKWIGHVMIVTGCGFREGAHSERLTKQTVFFASTILLRLRVNGAVIHCFAVNIAHCASRFRAIHFSYTGGVGVLTPCLSLVAISSFLNPISSLASRLLKHQSLDRPPIILNTDRPFDFCAPVASSQHLPQSFQGLQQPCLS